MGLFTYNPGITATTRVKFEAKILIKAQLGKCINGFLFHFSERR